MTEIKKEHLTELYDILQRQLVEDRELLMSLYTDLKKQVNEPQDYAINGQTLAKMSENIVKQTAQLIEIIKVNQKEVSKDERVDLTDEDKKDIYQQIKQ